jgi:hypothetical protein
MVYIIKFRRVDTLQTHFAFLGWPFEYAVVTADTPLLADKLLRSKIEANSIECQILSTSATHEDVHILPIKIESNTVVDIEREKEDERVELARHWLLD